MLVTEVLEDFGYASIEAADGPTGLKVLQSKAKIDLLITDLGLGNGHLDAGMQVLTKPFAMETLARRIKGMVEGSAG
jgi:DNA-binding response OmpR family regulator